MIFSHPSLEFQQWTVHSFKLVRAGFARFLDVSRMNQFIELETSKHVIQFPTFADQL